MGVPARFPHEPPPASLTRSLDGRLPHQGVSLRRPRPRRPDRVALPGRDRVLGAPGGLVRPGAHGARAEPAASRRRCSRRPRRTTCRPPAGPEARSSRRRRARSGQSEQPPGSNDGPAIAQYRSAVAGAEAGEPWCAYFVSWAAAQAGAPLGEEGQGLGSVAGITSWAQSTGRLLPASATPQPWDLILFGTQHVGIVESVNPDGTLTTIEEPRERGPAGHPEPVRGDRVRRCPDAFPAVRCVLAEGFAVSISVTTSGGVIIPRRNATAKRSPVTPESTPVVPTADAIITPRTAPFGACRRGPMRRPGPRKANHTNATPTGSPSSPTRRTFQPSRTMNAVPTVSPMTAPPTEQMRGSRWPSCVAPATLASSTRKTLAPSVTD